MMMPTDQALKVFEAKAAELDERRHALICRTAAYAEKYSGPSRASRTTEAVREVEAMTCERVALEVDQFAVMQHLRKIRGTPAPGLKSWLDRLLNRGGYIPSAEYDVPPAVLD